MGSWIEDKMTNPRFRTEYERQRRLIEAKEESERTYCDQVRRENPLAYALAGVEVECENAVEIAREDARTAALEEAARVVEGMRGSDIVTYSQVAAAIRALKEE